MERAGVTLKITWVSPNGDGWATAKKLRDGGNKVVYFNPSENKNGLGYLPSVPEAAWKDYALKSDLIVVDANFGSRATRRSFSPSDYVLDLAQIRRKGMQYIGPTPTSELFENDLRYQKKLLSRLGVPYVPTEHVIDGKEGVPLILNESDIRLTVSRDPDGRCYLVFRHRHLLADGNGPEIGNLGDVVISLRADSKLVQQSTKLVEPLLERLRFNGYFNLDLVLTHDSQPHIAGLTTSFLYPAVFAQFASFLSGDSQRSDLGLAVTVLRLDQDSDTSAEQVMNLPGFFGCEIHRDFDEGRAVVHSNSTATTVGGVGVGGPPNFVGAIVSCGPDFPSVKDKVDRQLMGSLPRGWGFRDNLGGSAGDSLRRLNEFGLL